MDTELISVQEALDCILASIAPVSIVNVSLDQAADQVLAEECVAPFDLPAFDNAAMDGYAVRSEDLMGASETQPVKLKVTGEVPAGHVPQFLLEIGCAARITTGALLPEGVDAVVPVEDVEEIEGGPGGGLPIEIQITGSVHPGDYSRKAGEDVVRGSVILTAGVSLGPAQIGMLASLGVSHIRVRRPLTVALISSGDEVVEVGDRLQSRQIFDSNRHALKAALKRYQCEILDLDIIPDEEKAVIQSLETAIRKKVDLIISSAGVGTGVFDYVRRVIELNGDLKFWRVNMRPGKPLVLGSYQGTPFLGLPGNPVSALVTFEFFAIPIIGRMQGRSHTSRTRIRVELAQEIHSDGL